MPRQPQSLNAAFDPDHFREAGHRLVDTLGDFLERSLARFDQPVLPDLTAEEMLRRWSGQFSADPGQHFPEIIDSVLGLSNNLQHPGYIGHQCCTPLPLSALTDLVGTFINNASAVYEMGPVNIAMEKRLIQWMTALAGFGPDADGIFTNGGTIGNLTALLAARQVRAPYDVWSRGIDSSRRLALLVSDQCHYSVKRAAGVMGIGEDGVYLVPVNAEFRMTRQALENTFRAAESDGRTVFTVVGNACSTATGTYDDLHMLADFAADHSLWFHVDGAHGASALISEQYRHLLSGLERADSLVWDTHKMMMVPALATAVLFRDGAHSYESFSQKASYLFEQDSRDEWYNYAHRTMECTKTMMGIKLYVPLMVYGTALFSDFIDYTYGLTREFARMIADSSDFETAADPESNIICFRYTGKEAPLDAMQKEIRKKVLQSGRYYIVQTEINGGFWLRCTIINPNTTGDDLAGLLQLIRSCAR
ncbi:pyridoxal-dependent decarboxylase [bacterium]|nr:pyridoxal-dependent decarboxylase [bacterium]